MRSAIMDIGYNAIRAVVYENETLGAPEIFNSKFKSDILNLLTSDSIDIKHQTYLTIEYLLHVFENLNVTNIQCVATAVLRNHPRADLFINHIKTKYNFDINIISGEEEAKLTALGLISGIKNTHGMIADLGGGSLELIEINNEKIGQLKSFELGTKVLSAQSITDEHDVMQIIKEQYGDNTYETLYLIGGALRFIGRIYVDFIQYPLKNLHNLEIQTPDLLNYLSKLEISSQDVKSKVGRRHINRNAIFIAKAMIKTFQPEKIIISTFGLKEGVRISKMSEEEKNKDVLLEKVKYTCKLNDDKTNWLEYFNIVNPLLPENVDYHEEIKLSILLSSFKRTFDHTLPPLGITEFILSSEMPFTHKMRVMLALIQSYSTNFKPNFELIKISKKLISKEEHNHCQIIGHFLSIAEAIDGPIFSSPSFTITIKGNYLGIESKRILPRLIFEKICNKLKSIAFARKIDSNIS